MHRKNHPHHSVLIAAALVGGMASIGNHGIAWGQVPSPAAPVSPASPTPTVVPPAAPTVPAPDGTLKKAAALDVAQARLLANFVTVEVAALASPDPSIATGARKALESASWVYPQPDSTSPAYQDAFAAAFAPAAVKAMSSTDVRARVNVAVALATVASRMREVKFSPAIMAALKDKSDAVVLWGIKAAVHCYPFLLGGAQKDATSMAVAVNAAVRTYPTSAAIADEASATLSGELVKDPAAAPNYANAVDGMIGLLQTRAFNFADAQPPGAADTDAAFPPNPGAVENSAMNFLSLNAWPVMTPAQRAAAGRAMVDLTAEMVRMGPLTKRREVGEQDEPRQEDLLGGLMRNAVLAIGVAAGKAPGGPTGKAVSDEAQALAKLTQTTQPNPAAMDERMTSLQAAMTVAAILGPKPTPPPVAPIAPVTPTLPTTKPATGVKPPAPAAKAPIASGRATVGK